MKTELFKNMDTNEMKQLLKFTKSKNTFFKKDMTIISNLKNTNKLGIVIEGEVSLIKIDYNGNKSIIDIYKANKVFGGCFIDNTNDELSIIANCDTEILFLDYNKLFLDDNKYSKQIMKNIINMMTKRLNENSVRIDILVQKTIREKLLEYFKSLEFKSLNSEFMLDQSYTSLAEYLGVNRSALMRELKNLKEEGIITIDNKRVTIIYR